MNTTSFKKHYPGRAFADHFLFRKHGRFSRQNPLLKELHKEATKDITEPYHHV